MKRLIPITGIYSHGLSNQISNYKKYGYILIKRNDLISKSILNEARGDILKYFDSIQNTYYYRFWRLFNHVNSQQRRHSIELPSSIKSVNEILKLSIGTINNFLQSILLCKNSPLVEMSAIISQTKSEDQSIHSDIPCINDSELISCFIALQKIDLNNGATYLYPESHTYEFHQYKNKNQASSSSSSQVSYFDCEGTIIENDISEEITSNNNVNEDINLKQKNDNINNSLPHAAILDIGDLLIFNSKIFHYGSANLSQYDRLLLSFTFQKLNDGKHIPIKGFTYHLSNSMKNDKKILNDYPQI